MARKPANPRKVKKSKAKSKAQHKLPLKGQHKAKPAHTQAHAKRTAAKHKALKNAARMAWLPAPLKSALSKSIKVPKLGVELPVMPTLVFVTILGFAVGAGYWGAKSVFGDNAPSTARRPAMVIQQTHSLTGVILPEPNGVEPHKALAYEEKAQEEVYDPTPTQEPAPLNVEVARATPPTDEVPTAEPEGPKPLWMQNALAFTPTAAGAPMIAIVIDDMGVDRKRSKRMWQDVGAPLTLSFMTYADDLPAQTGAARAKGHELMLHMSMEPSSAQVDAGPNVLLTTMPSGEIRSLANWGMDRFEGFIGVNNHMGSRFTEDERGMRIVLEEIQKRGLMFLDSRTSNRTVGPKIAKDLGVPALERNVFLDNDNVPQKVLNQLAEVERLARKYGHAIAIGHPRDATIEVLKAWIDQARARGLSIVPLSTIMKLKINPATQVQKQG